MSAMRILVSQTTRMGDVIQTTPLLRGLKQKYPGAHITFMVRNMGKPIAESNPDVDDVIVYDEDDMFLSLRAQDSDRLLRAYEGAEAYIRKLKEGNFDVAYNCTHSIGSAMLLKLAGIPKVVGAHLSDDWEFVLRGPWVTYFFTSVFHRDYNDLNLCDIGRRFLPDAGPRGELVFELRQEDKEFADGLLHEHGAGPDDFVACFQLGASEDNKRWSEACFARLGRQLADKYGARIFLVGVKGEEGLGEVFEEHSPGLAVPLYGKTNLGQVAALLERANLLVTNDTGTMHVGAAVGCPLVLVSVGYVHFRETGPYGEGHCAIEWRRATLGRMDLRPEGLEAERSRILPEQVMRAVELTLASKAGEPVAQAPEAQGLAAVDIYMTRFAPDGCLEWYPVLRRPMTETDFLRIVYRAMWLDYLKAKADKHAERESLDTMLGYYEAPMEGSLKDWGDEFSPVFEELAKMAKRGMADTKKLLGHLDQSGKARKAQQVVQGLLELDEEMRLYSELHNACKPLILSARFERDNLEGADPRVLAKTTLEIYRDCFVRARLMTKKIARVVDMWQHRD